MIPIYIRMIETAALSALAVTLYLVYKTQPRKDAMFAMLLSSVGDVLIVNSSSIGEFSTFIGAGFFIAAHIIYGECFRKQICQKKKKYFNPAFFFGTAVMAASAAVIGYLAFTVPEEKKPVMFALILFYIAAIGYNVCSNYSCASSFGKTYLLLPPAVTAFYLTDIFIFTDMLNINHDLRQYVWFIYPVSQLILVLFNSPLKKED